LRRNGASISRFSIPAQSWIWRKALPAVAGDSRPFLFVIRLARLNYVHQNPVKHRSVSRCDAHTHAYGNSYTYADCHGPGVFSRKDIGRTIPSAAGDRIAAWERHL
jgi:hypothetical protein